MLNPTRITCSGVALSSVVNEAASQIAALQQDLNNCATLDVICSSLLANIQTKSTSAVRSLPSSSLNHRLTNLGDSKWRGNGAGVEACALGIDAAMDRMAWECVRQQKRRLDAVIMLRCSNAFTLHAADFIARYALARNSKPHAPGNSSPSSSTSLSCCFTLGVDLGIVHDLCHSFPLGGAYSLLMSCKALADDRNWALPQATQPPSGEAGSVIERRVVIVSDAWQVPRTIQSLSEQYASRACNIRCVPYVPSGSWSDKHVSKLCDYLEYGPLRQIP